VWHVLVGKSNVVIMPVMSVGGR